MVNITVKSSQMVQPAVPTPQRDVWTSNVDLVAVRKHATSVYFYRPNGSDSSVFFSMDVLKDALSKVLVPFYPIAGRLKKDTHEHGRILINCNAEGALLVEAVTDSVINDFGDFAPSEELTQLVPQVDYTSQDVSSFPLALFQVNHRSFFKLAFQSNLFKMFGWTIFPVNVITSFIGSAIVLIHTPKLSCYRDNAHIEMKCLYSKIVLKLKL